MFSYPYSYSASVAAASGSAASTTSQIRSIYAPLSSGSGATHSQQVPSLSSLGDQSTGEHHHQLATAIPGYSYSQQSQHSAYQLPVPPSAQRPEIFHCDYCNVDLCGTSEFSAHVKTDRHQAIVANRSGAKSVLEPALLSPPQHQAIPPSREDVRAAASAASAVQRNPRETVYYCDVCRERVKSEYNWFHHLIGKQHDHEVLLARAHNRDIPPALALATLDAKRRDAAGTGPKPTVASQETARSVNQHVEIVTRSPSRTVEVKDKTPVDEVGRSVTLLPSALDISRNRGPGAQPSSSSASSEHHSRSAGSSKAKPAPSSSPRHTSGRKRQASPALRHHVSRHEQNRREQLDRIVSEGLDSARRESNVQSQKKRSRSRSPPVHHRNNEPSPASHSSHHHREKQVSNPPKSNTPTKRTAAVRRDVRSPSPKRDQPSKRSRSPKTVRSPKQSHRSKSPRRSRSRSPRRSRSPDPPSRRHHRSRSPDTHRSRRSPVSHRHRRADRDDRKRDSDDRVKKNEDPSKESDRDERREPQEKVGELEKQNALLKNLLSSIAAGKLDKDGVASVLPLLDVQVPNSSSADSEQKQQRTPAVPASLTSANRSSSPVDMEISDYGTPVKIETGRPPQGSQNRETSQASVNRFPPRGDKDSRQLPGSSGDARGGVQNDTTFSSGPQQQLQPDSSFKKPAMPSVVGRTSQQHLERNQHHQLQQQRKFSQQEHHDSSQSSLRMSSRLSIAEEVKGITNAREAAAKAAAAIRRAREQERQEEPLVITKSFASGSGAMSEDGGGGNRASPGRSVGRGRGRAHAPQTQNAFVAAYNHRSGYDKEESSRRGFHGANQGFGRDLTITTNAKDNSWREVHVQQHGPPIDESSGGDDVMVLAQSKTGEGTNRPDRDRTGNLNSRLGRRWSQQQQSRPALPNPRLGSASDRPEIRAVTRSADATVDRDLRNARGGPPTALLEDPDVDRRRSVGLLPDINLSKPPPLISGGSPFIPPATTGHASTIGLATAVFQQPPPVASLPGFQRAAMMAPLQAQPVPGAASSLSDYHQRIAKHGDKLLAGISVLDTLLKRDLDALGIDIISMKAAVQSYLTGGFLTADVRERNGLLTIPNLRDDHQRMLLFIAEVPSTVSRASLVREIQQFVSTGRMY